MTREASPEQYLTASQRRGYSGEYLSATCVCECPRSAHAKLSRECPCGCQAFRQARVAQADHDPLQPGAALRKKYILGTLPAPEARANINTHVDVTESGILHAVAMDTAREAAEGNGGAVLVPREGSATRCPFCLADDFESVPSLKCPNCKAWQHLACVREHGRCAACNEAWSGA